MNLGALSVNRPILAMVLSIVLLIVGAIAYTTLPVAEYPQVVPPTVVVTTQYPGASAQTVSDTVAAPLEQPICAIAYTTLPVAEYPQVVPPTVVVTTQYPGASAQTVSDTVAAPLEQQIY